jgi:hypothetical protein
MSPRRLIPLLVVGAILGLSWVVLALFDPDGRGRLSEYVGLGYLFGTLFGQTTLAAAWTALGPFPWYVRLALATIWLVILWGCLVMNIGLHGGPGAMLLLFAGCLLGQWALVQIPLWGLALGYRLHFQHRTEFPQANPLVGTPGQLQFGIRQLLTLTTIVAIVLAALRALVLAIIAHLDDRGVGEGAIFIFLAIAAVVMTLPLVVAALLPRWALPSTLAVLVLIGLATLWELPLLSLLPKTAGPDTWHFIFINACTSAWILVIIGVLRLGGYCLAAVNLGMSQEVAKRSLPLEPQPIARVGKNSGGGSW